MSEASAARQSERPWSGWRGPCILLLVLAIYLATHLLIRLALSPSLIPDEADIALFSQSLAWGYSEQPPLYSWIVWAFVHVLGLSIFTLTLVKLLILAAVHLYLYSVARRLLCDQRLALLAVFSLFLLPTFAWNAVNYLTHSLLLCAVCLATFRCVLVLPEKRTLGAYVLLGVCVGLGILSKYNYVVFALALLLACLGRRTYRDCLVDRRLLLAGAVALLVVLPHALWALAHRAEIWGVLTAKTGMGTSHGWAGIGKGMLNLLCNNVLLLTLPLVLAIATVFRPNVRCLWRSTTAGTAGRRLLECFFVCTLVLLTLQVVLGGTTRFQDRWLSPFLLLVPIWCFARLEGVALEGWRVRRYAVVLTLLALGITAGQASRIWLGSRDNGVYPLQMSFDAAARQLAEEGFRDATIVASDRVIAGNLCLCFPEARVFCAWHPGYRPPAAESGRPSFAVWHLNMGTHYPPLLDLYAARSLSMPVAPLGAVNVVTVPPIHPGRNVNHFGVVRLVPTAVQTVRPPLPRPSPRASIGPGI